MRGTLVRSTRHEAISTFRQPYRFAKEPANGIVRTDPIPIAKIRNPSCASVKLRRALTKGTRGAHVEAASPRMKNPNRVAIASRFVIVGS